MYNDLDIDNYREQFESGNSGEYQLIDVREEDEYEAGHIPGTINIPMSEFQARFDEISEDSPVVLVCATGNRSSQVAMFMASMGYSDLYNLEDGTRGWMMRGLPLE